MNIQNAMRPRRDEDRREQTHVACQADEIRLRLREDAQNFFFVRSASRVVAVIHEVRGQSELTRTRLFRGRVLSLLAVEHLYHLEHHLYPQVPHHNWPELARRLDPCFEKLGVRPIKLFF